MRAIGAITISLLSVGSDVLAAGHAPAREGPTVLTLCFVSFCLVMGLCQVFPALKLVAGKVRERLRRAG